MTMTLKEFSVFIRNLPDEDDFSAEIGFDMSHEWVERKSTEHPCGTAMCIGGWVQQLFPETRTLTTTDALVAKFGIGFIDAKAMCYPKYEGWDANKNQAANMIDWYIETGSVDWQLAMSDV